MTTNIYKKLLELQKAVKGLGKDAKGNGYEYVSGSKLLSYVRPQMDKLGLILKQEIISIENHREDYQTRNGAKADMFTSIKMRFTWVDTETGEVDVNEFFANGLNGWDKGLGSALTYGERYFLLKYFHIATDEDDVNAIVRDDEADANNTAKGKKSTTTAAPTQAPSAPTTQTINMTELQNAINEANGAQNAEELTAIWNKHKNIFGKNTDFKKAIANSPVNPNKKK